MTLRYIYLFAALLLLTACGNTKQKEPAAAKPAAAENIVTLTPAQIKNAGIVTGPPLIENMNSSIKVSGLVDVPPQNMVSVSFPSGGYLKSTQLLPGMRVRKGESIAVMQDQSLIQLQQDYLVSRAKVNYLQKEYERQKSLNATKTSSDKVFEQVSNEYQVERVIVNSLKEKLLMAGINPAGLTENNISRSVSIHSPINGYVASVKVNIGKYVNPADVLFELVNPDDIHLALKVFEKDLPYISVGQKVKARLVSNPGKTYLAEIILISKNLDENRSSLIHCHFENSNHDLLPGMFLNAEIETTNAAAVTVPDDAVVRFGDKQYIFVQRTTTQFEMMEIQPGNSSGGKTAIASGSTSFTAQQVVTKNAYALLMKLKNTAEE
jgi:membrane fusion protein, heavy metal efflux system